MVAQSKYNFISNCKNGPRCADIHENHIFEAQRQYGLFPLHEVQYNTRSVRKVSDRIFLCEHLMDYNLARLHEPTLNLSAHA